MPSRAKDKLTALQVERAVKAGTAAKLADGGGLTLIVGGGRAAWTLRSRVNGKARELGLGRYPAVSLADARAKARELRETMAAGVDPIAEREAKAAADRCQAEQARAEAEREARTFESVARVVHVRQRFANARLSQRWIGRLERFAFPKLGALPVDAVDGPAVLDALEPIWTAKPETARRVRQLVGKVLTYAHVKGWRGPAPALAEHTKALPAHGPAVNLAAVDYEHAPVIFAALMGAGDTMARLALRFAILTAARSGEVRGATWGEVDLDAGVWRVPAARMKMRRDHAVPLSAPALDVLRRVAAFRTATDPAALIFPGEGVAVDAAGAKRAKPLSDVALTKANRLVAPGTTVHGWRSTFRDWAGETTSFPADVCEAALAHLVGNATTRAYARGDLFAKRRALMDAWAAYVAPIAASNVIPLRRAG